MLSAERRASCCFASERVAGEFHYEKRIGSHLFEFFLLERSGRKRPFRMTSRFRGALEKIGGRYFRSGGQLVLKFSGRLIYEPVIRELRGIGTDVMPTGYRPRLYDENGRCRFHRIDLRSSCGNVFEAFLEALERFVDTRFLRKRVGVVL